MNQRADSMRVMYPLFQGEEGGATPTSALSAKQLVIERIPFERAKELNRAWHSRLPRVGQKLDYVCFGAMHGKNCYAVGMWTIPVARMLNGKGWLELRRLAVSPDARRNTCSRMLAVMERLICKDRPSIVKLISYQDMEVHRGTIYKAAGWTPTKIERGHDWNSAARIDSRSQSTAPKQRREKSLTLTRA